MKQFYLMPLVCIVAPATVAAQTPAPKDMGELIAALKDPGLTTLQKNQLVGTIYSGVVEVNDVEGVQTYGDKAANPTVQIMIDPRVYNGNIFVLAFETTDVERATQLRKGNKITISGKLARFDVHKSGYMNLSDREWVIFKEVVIH